MPQKKNIIWIFGDQHRSQALGIHGDPNLHTPNIDNLVRNGGIDFPNALMGTPLCCPCRGSLLTSLYPHECVAGHELPMPDGCRTVAHAFSEHGYETAWFGKWHVDGFKERDGRAALHTIPTARRGGFDTWLGYENNNSQYDCYVHGHEKSRGEVAHYKLPGYETDELTNLLINFIEGRKLDGDDTTPPFFAALSVQPPHDPYVAPEEQSLSHTPENVILRANVPPIPSVVEQARADLAGYYAMIENLDWNIGRVKQALHDAGLEDSTFLVFFSDHGDQHGSHGQFRKTSPLEESIRVPFIIGGGALNYERRMGKSRALVNHVDVAPTSLGLCGLEAPSWMRGRDLSGFYLQSRPLPEVPDSAYLALPIPTGHPDSVDHAWRGIVTDDGWKFVCLEGQPWLMFNLKEDPYELVNHAFNSRYKAKRKELLERLRRWIADTGDKFALPEL